MSSSWGFLNDVSDLADTVGDKIESGLDYFGDKIESGFSNLGRKTVDLGDEERAELDAYFDAADSGNVGGFGLSQEQEAKYQEYAEMGWKREMGEDGKYKYSREKTGKEVAEDLEDLSGAIPSGKAASRGALFNQKPPGIPGMPRGSVGYRQVENPYQVPSYLMSSAQYNEQISKLLGGLLTNSIRNNPIKYLV